MKGVDRDDERIYRKTKVKVLERERERETQTSCPIYAENNNIEREKL